MIAKADKNGNGAIDFDEFYHMMTIKFGKRNTGEDLIKAFYINDEDKNGKVPAPDIQYIAKELAKHFSHTDAQEIIKV